MKTTTSKEYLKKVNGLLVKKLESFDDSIPVFADGLSESEVQEYGYNYILYATGNFNRPDDMNDDYSMNQQVYITFVSQNRNFLDGDILELIKLITSAKHKVRLVEKDTREVEKQDNDVDIIVFTCDRLVKTNG